MARLRTKAWCKHYRGVHERKECEAGVRFDSLPLAGTKGFMEACPCFGPVGGCDKAEYPTADELEANSIELAKRFANIGKAREAIVAVSGGVWKKGMAGSSGIIDCPACSGEKTLRFSRAGYNGHIHAACTTDGCVRWME